MCCKLFARFIFRFFKGHFHLLIIWNLNITEICFHIKIASIFQFQIFCFHHFICIQLIFHFLVKRWFRFLWRYFCCICTQRRKYCSHDCHCCKKTRYCFLKSSVSHRFYLILSSLSLRKFQIKLYIALT